MAGSFALALFQYHSQFTWVADQAKRFGR